MPLAAAKPRSRFELTFGRANAGYVRIFRVSGSRFRV
jgi:hypothetical protein